MSERSRKQLGAQWRDHHRVHPEDWKRRSGRKSTVVPDGSDAWAPTKARPDETLIRAGAAVGPS